MMTHDRSLLKVNFVAMAAVHGRRKVEVVVMCWWLLVFIVLLLPLCYGDSVNISHQKFDVDNQLKRLNKPPLKSIKSPDGDIIDCVHISHQPAFDHPFLKNHTIQMRPNYYPKGVFEENNVSIPKSNEGMSKPITQLWHMNGSCPEGTIPIRRTKRVDVLRASSIKSFGKKHHRTIPEPPRSAESELINLATHQHAIASVQGDKYYGTMATMNIWNPRVQQPNEFSLSQLWIMGGSYSTNDLNTIEAGWQVFPQLYGDYNTRLFNYWTSDAYQTTGCYNLLCSGFVQTSSEIAMGATIPPVSAYGSTQHELRVLVWKEPKDGNWWMQVGNNYVGYWPSSLFSYLANSASMIEWGGEVINLASDGKHTTTQMGSGHFSKEQYGKASYFKNIQIVDGSNNLRAPQDVTTFATQSNCYDVQIGNGGDWGNYIFYGGPGRNPNCP